MEQLKALLAWFKKDFFKWTDQPDCPKCGNEGKNLKPTGGVQPTDEEREGMASRVESYLCLKCNTQVRYPRYN